MNIGTLWQHGHDALISGLHEPEWERKVCPEWTLRDAIINLTTMEYLLSEVLESIIHGTETPTLERFLAGHDQFNRMEIAERRSLTGAAVLDEYRYAYSQTRWLIAQVPREKWREVGTVPWYGPEFSLEDFVVLFLFEHKRGYVAQIMQSRHANRPLPAA